jgi:Tfp pilus assembly protein PilF
VPAVSQDEPRGDPRVEAETFFQRGCNELDQGRTIAARQHFDAAYRLHPSDEYGLYQVWASFLSASSSEVAELRETVESRMMDCLRADRRMAFGHYVAGRLALLDEEFETAAKSFKRAVVLDPDLNDAARSLRLAQQRLGGKKS